ncbi:MAG TPA: sugar transferase [Blastocatellia bacterium]|nr:sugar transferase [Blastocatellia bacterium]HMV87070.1 sugar transferase [Blastocatellia bacterium]HMX24508.1 sugar transferase [Blastocatellia bacterium]HMZ17338.1 sugar transferase [Blastocatellia bacterium]HNG30461.1 sugar transferase [Blastocatellia bacterium]
MFPQYLTNTLLTRDGLTVEPENRWSPPGREYLVKTYRLFDVVAALLALIAVFTLTSLNDLPNGLASFLTMRITVKNLLLLAGFSLLWQGIFKLFRLYDPVVLSSYREEARRVMGACLLGSLCALSIPLASEDEAFSYQAVLYFLGTATVTILLTRHVIHALRPEWTPQGRHTRRILIVGSGPRALKLYNSLVGQPKPMHRVVGFLDSRSTQEMDATVATQLIGGLDQLEDVLSSRVIDEVLIALPIKSCYNQIQQAIETCERIGIECKYLSDIFNVSHAKPQVESNSHFSLISLKMVRDDYRLLVKRALDIVGATAALVIFSPVMLLAALAVKLTSKGPAIFVQERYGLNKRRFKMFKFRTMVVNAEALQSQLEQHNEAQGPVFKIKNDPRVTSIGGFLRKTSIDELPQLFNVLRGDMSLVGPRPLPERDVSRFMESSLLRRFSVKPGLTCLWQISGRSNTQFDHWIRQDLQYIDQWSLGLDIAILFKTVPAVIKGRGAV